MTSILSYASSLFCASLRAGSHVRVRGKFWPARKLLFFPNLSKGRKSLSANRSSGEEGKEKKLFSSSVSSPLHPYASVMIMIIIIYRTPLYRELPLQNGRDLFPPSHFQGKSPRNKVGWESEPFPGNNKTISSIFRSLL